MMRFFSPQPPYFIPQFPRPFKFQILRRRTHLFFQINFQGDAFLIAQDQGWGGFAFDFCGGGGVVEGFGDFLLDGLGVMPCSVL